MFFNFSGTKKVKQNNNNNNNNNKKNSEPPRGFTFQIIAKKAEHFFFSLKFYAFHSL